MLSLFIDQLIASIGYILNFIDKFLVDLYKGGIILGNLSKN